ncbi:MAG: hypothetical protein E7169_04735 [Firmicutes bacterium]|nr:hypothetical protein [Bacillota bacterium]
MGKEKNINYDNIKFENVALPRYIKVKESIEELMAIIDTDKVKEDGTDRVLTALLQLIDENDDKIVEEKREDILDAIYNGNIFSRYFNEDTKAQAVDVLSKTSLLNDEERFIYIVNFYMPYDIDFTNVYKECGKNVDKIIKYYGLANNSDAQKFVYGRIVEISKFFKNYTDEKNRQKLLLETQTLAAMKDVTDNPTKETIQKVRDMVVSLPNEGLKTTLLAQLDELEETLVEEAPEVKQPVIDPKALREGFASLNGDASSIKPVTKEEHIEDVVSAEETSVETSLEEEPTEIGTPIEVETEEVIETPVQPEAVALEEPVEEEAVQEPKDLSIVSETNLPSTGDNVAKDVMGQLQALVSDAKQKSLRVIELEELLKAKDAQIADLTSSLGEANDLVASQEEQLKKQGEQISSLEQAVKEKDNNLFEAGKLLAQKDKEIDAKTKEVEVANQTADSYKKSLTEIQTFLLNNATPTVTPEEKGVKTV